MQPVRRSESARLSGRRPVGFDLETAGANTLFTHAGESPFVRLAGYSSEDGPRTTTDIPELLSALDDAPYLYGHNVLGFDLLALSFHHGADWERLSRKTLDTMILDRLDYPPEARDTGGSVDKYDLDASCARRGVGGKTDNLKELAKEFGGYDQIPTDDARYIEYLKGDITAIENLIKKLPRNDYAKREHQVQSWLGRMTLNGFKVDIPLLEDRIAQGEKRKQDALEILRDDYDLPLGRFEWSGRGKDKIEHWEEFKSPLGTLEGKRWLEDVWDSFGVRNPPLTPTKEMSTKAADLREMMEDNVFPGELTEILNEIMIVTQIRTVYQTTQDHLIDGYVHAGINMGQASGRSSVTNPGLTVFGKRNGRHIERDIFIAPDGWSVFTSDLRQVDMRGIAALCQDPAYMALFENGRDPHTEIAVQLFGSADFRDQVKPITHGSNYGLGQKKLIAQGHDPAKVRRYFAERKSQFPLLMKWQDEAREMAATGELIGSHGRRMRCDSNRAYTQGPALMGQNSAAEILKECILRLDDSFRPYVVTMVHDEIVFCAPTKDLPEIMPEVERAMTFEFRGVPIECDLSKSGKSWGEVCGK